MLKGIIFDLDNTLIDSIKMQRASYASVLAQYGFVLDEEDSKLIQHIIYWNEEENWKLIIKEYGFSETLNVLIKKRNDVYIDILLNKPILRPGVLKILNIFKENNLKMGIASNSSLENIQLAVKGLKIETYFSCLVSAEFMKPKPSPDVFLTAAQKLNIDKLEVLAIEDSELGILAAKTAGMKVIAVPNVISKITENMSNADLVVDSLTDLKWAMVKNIFIK